MSKSNKPVSYINKPSSSKLDADGLKRKTDSELVSELKGQWKLMWQERFNDKVKAEGISLSNYTALNIEKGTVIQATRDFKATNFKEILEQHKIENPDRFITPDNSAGGWNKFIKTKITNNKPLKEKHPTTTHNTPAKIGQHHKKGGRGWLHNI